MMTQFEVWTDDAGIRSLHVKVNGASGRYADWRLVRFL